MTDADIIPLSLKLEINRLCAEFVSDWTDANQPSIEKYISRLAGQNAREHALRELIMQEVFLRRSAGDLATVDEYVRRFPGERDAVDATFADLNRRNQLVENSFEKSLLLGDETQSKSSNKNPACRKDEELLSAPDRLGRFEVIRLLGRGGFGDVYLARDSILDRMVALKLPRAEHFSSPKELFRFTDEARIAAQLSHVGIVGIHDVVLDGGNVFIVQEFIDGYDLAEYLKSHSLTIEQIADLMIKIAEAVAFAHRQNFVHRDLKPSNILLDRQNVPRIADFGMAVHENILRRRRGEVAGSPKYMSPEQVRGETHRLDGRSDIWSLGVILYELLAGCRPFQGDNQSDLFDAIQNRDPKPLNPKAPKELERICLKCLSKRITDRYADATGLVKDLQRWLDDENDSASDRSANPTKVVPKGLRSFDSHDARFFLDLLPGPRDHNGVTESIRFWKTQIDETDADNTFAVGLIYGPSGCGKSSLVKAGLLPRLALHVTPVYIESAAEDTELRLIKGLRKHINNLPGEISLRELVQGLREGVWETSGQKILIVLDQFEQWLHAHRDDAESALLDALRHCDGGRVQCLIMVRDDFWLATSRFMRGLEVRLIDGENQAMIDLFDPLHARKVLIEFGRAFDRLPTNLDELSSDQKLFLDRAVEGLTQNGKIVCVRLSLFADMIKGKRWTMATLKEVGGTEGLGQAFLEETFSAPTAPAEHRHHLKAIQSVLKALLPDVGTDIKGSRQSDEQLRRASGYTRGNKDFDDVMRILDSSLRLITPTDSEALDTVKNSTESQPTKKYYQLTHDYLVRSLRKWLTRKQMETRRGRAELRLAERSALWSAKPENRHLPASWEFLNIRLVTSKQDWTESQRTMMERAGRFHGLRGISVLLALTAVVVASFLINQNLTEMGYRNRAASMVSKLLKSELEHVPGIVREIVNFREDSEYLDSLLLEEHEKAANLSAEKLRTTMALLPVNKNLASCLCDHLLVCSINDLGVIRDSLQPNQDAVIERLWNAFRDTSSEKSRFRAGLVLTKYVADDEQWTDEDSTFLVDNLLAHEANEQLQIRYYLTDIKTRLFADLERAFRDGSGKESKEIGSALALAQFESDDLRKIAELASDATARQYLALFPLLEASTIRGVEETLRAIATRQPEKNLPQTDRVILGRRRAGAAITLMRLGDREHFFNIFQVSDDPEALTQFAHGCRERGVTVAELLECLYLVDTARQIKTHKRRKADNLAVFGLLVTLGEFSAKDVDSSQLEELVDRLVHLYGNDPSSRIHGAAGWLLRHWGYQEQAEKIDHTEVALTNDREWFIRKIEADDSSSKDNANKTKSYFLTFIVFEAGEYIIGAPDHEADQQADETMQTVRLTRPFAVLDREITRAEFEAFGGVNLPIDIWSPPPGKHPMVAPSWYSCVEFCRALTTQAGLSVGDQCYDDPASIPTDEFPRETEAEFNEYPRNWEVRLDRSGFRLPTESEWEMACRAGTRSTYHFGSDQNLLNRYGWVKETDFKADQDNNRKSQLPRTLRPNLRGLFDMHGNVWEWCHDWYIANRELTAEDPIGPPDGSSRVLRGGSWYRARSFSRSANRYVDIPSQQYSDRGFRILFGLPPIGQRFANTSDAGE